jgi:hypothetical protein
MLPLLPLLLFLTYQCQNRKEEKEKINLKNKIGKAYMSKARVPFYFSLYSFFPLSNIKVPVPYLGSTLE